MSKKSSVANTEAVERRKRWRDRRKDSERRSSVRFNLSGVVCRSGLPRRASDVSGELTDGEIWWNKGVTRYE